MKTTTTRRYFPAADASAGFAIHALSAAIALAFASNVCAQQISAPGATPVQIARLPAGSIVSGMAVVSYTIDGQTQIEVAQSNPVSSVVQAVPAVSLSAGVQVRRSAASPVLMSHLLSNVGNVDSLFSIAVGGGGCVGDFALSGVEAYHDKNGSGAVDAGDALVSGGVWLAAGQSANLLVKATSPAGVASGQACLSVVASTGEGAGLQVATSATHNVVSIGSTAAVSLMQTAITGVDLVRPGSEVGYQVTASNTGDQDALPSAVMPAGQVIRVDGANMPLVVITEPIASGVIYRAGSLASSHVSAIKIFRLPGDPVGSYRSTGDDTGAIEVGVGLTQPLGRNSSVGFRLSAQVVGGQSTAVVSAAVAVLNDGSGVVQEVSNAVSIGVISERIGVSKVAGSVISNGDGTGVVRMTVRVRNYGSGVLYGLTLADALTGDARFGRYTAAVAPGQGEYTIVASSLRLVDRIGVATIADVDGSFTGESGRQQLLAADSVLGSGGEIVVQYDVRFSLSGAIMKESQPEVGASIVRGGQVVVTDTSVSGIDPDPDHDGDPSNNASPTRVSIAAPRLEVKHSSSVPRVTSQPGAYEVDYFITVSNTGTAAAPNVRVLDNLNCTFSGENVRWSLVGSPVMQKGVLSPASSYTGSAICDRTGQANQDSYSSAPGEVALSMTDGARALQPGQSEVVKLTVRAQVSDGMVGIPVSVSNRVWAVALGSNTVNVTRGLIMAAADARSGTLLSDPTGVIYNAVTREPVAGAVVTLTRVSCDDGSLKPVTPGELYYGDTQPGVYTFNPDGSVSMTTAETGAYSFFTRKDVSACVYRVSVTPPVGSGLVAPSSLIPAQGGLFASCRAVGPDVAPPQGDGVKWFDRVLLGARMRDRCDVTHNNVPLDPTASSGLVIRKEGNARQAEIADFVTYTLTLTNATGIKLKGVRITDNLPPGLAYVRGSSRMAGVALSDPQGGSGPELHYDLPAVEIEAGKSVSLSYRVRVGVGVPSSGEVINRARAQSGVAAPSILASNEASWRLKVGGGVFSEEAFVVGKVFSDCNANGMQDEGESGIPGVRLFLEDGTGAVTDAEGRWSLYGLRPVTHALKIDTGTLPQGAVVLRSDNRSGGSTRFLDSKKGELARANFSIGGCEVIAEEIRGRQAALDGRSLMDSEAGRVASRIDVAGRVVDAGGDMRMRPTHGQVDAAGRVRIESPLGAALIDLTPAKDAASLARPPASSLAATAAEAPPAAESKKDKSIEDLLVGADNKLAFLGVHDGDVQRGRMMNLRIKWTQGLTVELRVNGVEVSERRVGKRQSDPARKMEAREYVGIDLRAGRNDLALRAVDPFGNVRAEESLSVVAPGDIAQIRIGLPERLVADDGKTGMKVRLSLLDASGVPVTERVGLTLESSGGAAWAAKDLDPGEPGVQIFAEGGQVDVPLRSPAAPGDVRLRVSAGPEVVQEVRAVFLPDLRPLSASGILDGVINIGSRGLSLGGNTAANAFESELRSISGGDAKARAAFYIKGAVKGEYLLTAAYDSDKSTRDRLFRDIQPDEYYPVYGDASSKVFDAQTTQRLYVRVDKQRSYLLWGDFSSSSSPEIRQLSQTNRALTGMRHHYEKDGVRVDSFASNDNLNQVVEELAANGTSGPFFIKGAGDLYAGSERVEVITRDRNNPGVILRIAPAVRFSGYTIDPLTKTLMFTSPVHSVDDELNPQSIRLTYEVASGGPAFWVAGVDAQFRVTDRLQAGVIASMDRNPENPRRMTAGTVMARVGDGAILSAEVVATDSLLKGGGHGGRVALRQDGPTTRIQVSVARTSAGFDNPGASMAAGQDLVTAQVEEKLSADTALRVQGEFSRAGDQAPRKGAAAGVSRKIDDTWTADVSVRSGSATGLLAQDSVIVSAASTPSDIPSPSADTISLRARATAAINPKLKLFGEAERVVSGGDRSILAAGGSLQVGDRARVYGKYELVSGGMDAVQSAPFGRTVGLLGVETGYMEGGRAYNEFRLKDYDASRGLQSVIGASQSVKINEAWRANVGAERSVGAAATQDAAPQRGLVFSLGFEYLGQGAYKDRLRLGSSLESRRSSGGDAGLTGALGGALKIDKEWSLLSRASLSSTTTPAERRLLGRSQVGVAFRPAGHDSLDVLARYEYKFDTRRADVGSTDGRTSIVSLHGHWQQSKSVATSLRYAVKNTLMTADGLPSSYWAQMIYGRITKDLTRDWDVGIQAGVLAGKSGALQRSLGAEAGYRLGQDLWISVGGNVIGLRDDDLAGYDKTDSGFYIRLRFKFDEDLFAR